MIGEKIEKNYQRVISVTNCHYFIIGRLSTF